MTTQTTNPASPPSQDAVKGTARAEAEPEGALDIKQVISGSTSDVPISELTRKGFKHVKVLNQAVIGKLIAEAVDRVISKKASKISKEEREKVIQQSKSQFEALARERLARERDRISELERANESLLAETEDLRKRLLERDEEIGRIKRSGGGEGGDPERFAAALLERLPGLSGAPGGDLSALQKSLQEISARIDRLPKGAGAGIEVMDKEALIDSLFRMDSPESADSNIAKVKIKEAKAGGVKDTLAKLKAMQKGGKDGD